MSDHLSGDARFFDKMFKAILSQGITFEKLPDRAVLHVVNPDDPQRFRRLNFRHPMAVWTFAEIIQAIRDVSGVTLIEQLHEHRNLRCPRCDGRGGTEDAENNWIPCKRCGETGLI